MPLNFIKLRRPVTLNFRFSPLLCLDCFTEVVIPFLNKKKNVASSTSFFIPLGVNLV